MSKTDNNSKADDLIPEWSEQFNPYTRNIWAFYYTPCFRDSTLAGIGVGTLLSGHFFFQTRNILKTTNAFTFGLCVVGIGSYILCRLQYRAQIKMLRQAELTGYKKRQEKNTIVKEIKELATKKQ